MPLDPPSASNDYNLDDQHELTGQLISAIFKSISDRLKAREALEASFQSLIDEGTQAALTIIQNNLAPELADLQQAVSNAEQTIADIAANGVAPNSEKLGGELPAYYAAAASLASYLPKSSTEQVEIGNLLRVQDDDTEDDFWIHVNTNKFYILTDRNEDGVWDGPHPFELDNAQGLAYAYGERLAKASELRAFTASTANPDNANGSDGDIHLKYIP